VTIRELAGAERDRIYAEQARRWPVRDGKVEVFDCHIAFTTMFAQLGVQPDYASAVGK